MNHETLQSWFTTKFLSLKVLKILRILILQSIYDFRVWMAWSKHGFDQSEHALYTCYFMITFTKQNISNWKLIKVLLYTKPFMVSIKRFRILQTSRFLVFHILYQKSREWQKNVIWFTNTVRVCKGAGRSIIGGGGAYSYIRIHRL